MLGWTFLILLFWLRGPRLVRRFDRALWREPPLAVAGLWIAYAALTGLWVTVRQNYFYELYQLVFLFVFRLALRLWGSFEPRVRTVLAGSLVTSFVPITLIGLTQLRFEIPFLPPIDPELGVSNPSLMRYKNPMALALLAQIFLVAHFALGEPGRRRPPAWRLGFSLLLVLELAYLVLLQSRSAYVALAISLPWLLIPLLWRARDSRRVRRIVADYAAAALVLLAFAWIAPSSRQRWTLARYLEEEVWTLRGDRTTSLLNTLEMARVRPFGVGLGDWQTHYPVYWSHNRYKSFTEEVQVRRAHSDYVQLLDETGWQGLALWVLLLISSLAFAARRFRETGQHLFLLLALQLLAVAAAGDYLVEIPYNKFQLYVLLAILVQPSGEPSGRYPTERFPSGRQGSARWRLPAVAVTVLGIACIAYGVDSLRRSYYSAALREAMTEIGAAQASGVSPERLADRIALATVFGDRFDAGFGHEKTFHKDHLLLVHLARLRGDPQQALAHASEALRLHPYYPNAFRLMAELLRSSDPQLAAHYQEAYLYVLHQASSGFRRPYPPSPAKKRVLAKGSAT